MRLSDHIEAKARRASSGILAGAAGGLVIWAALIEIARHVAG